MSHFSSHDMLFMSLAISMARKCKPSDPKTTPMVGAVIAREDKLLAAAFRGEHDHAEKLALSEISKGYPMGEANVYTTLEPCTEHVRRKPGDSCTERLIEVHPQKVFVGMLDPNQGVCGRGISALQLAGIEVILFPPGLVDEIKMMNGEFIIEQQGLGIVIEFPQNGNFVKGGIIELGGRLANEPTENSTFIVVRKGGNWWPQGRIILDGKRWKGRANVGASEEQVSVQIVRANDLGKSLMNYYYKVGKLHSDARENNKIDLPFQDYPSIEMSVLPKGLDLQASIEVIVSNDPASANSKG